MDQTTSEPPLSGRSEGSTAEAAGYGPEHPRSSGQEMFDQLRSMFEGATETAGPTIKEAAARAADLAAVAAKHAGPLVHRIADATDVAGAKVAKASEHLARDLRSPASGGGRRHPNEPHEHGSSEQEAFGVDA